MNKPSELDTLLATIENVLNNNEISGISEAEAALATLRERVTALEAERDALASFKVQVERAALPHMAMSPERFSRDVHEILKASKQS